MRRAVCGCGRTIVVDRYLGHFATGTDLVRLLSRQAARNYSVAALAYIKGAVAEFGGARIERARL